MGANRYSLSRDIAEYVENRPENRVQKAAIYAHFMARPGMRLEKIKTALATGRRNGWLNLLAGDLYIRTSRPARYTSSGTRYHDPGNGPIVDNSIAETKWASLLGGARFQDDMRSVNARSALIRYTTQSDMSLVGCSADMCATN